MKVWEDLVNRLHSLLNKGPENTPVVSVVRDSGGGVSKIKIADLVLTLTYDDVVVLTVDLSTGTVNDVVTAIDADGDYTATLTASGFSSMLARGLFEDAEHDISQDAYLHYPTNLFIAEMSTYGWSLDEQWAQVRLAEKQLYINSSTGQWLDYWGKNYLNVDRYEGESDDLYSGRIIGELVRPTQNNYALEILVKDSLDIDATILDAWPNRAQLDPAEQDYSMGKFLLGMSVPNELSPAEAQELIDRVKNLVRTKKAAGTDFIDDALIIDASQSESVAVSELLAIIIIAEFTETLPGAILEYGRGFKYGADPVLTYGSTDTIVEQIIVRKLDESDDTVLTEEIYTSSVA